MDLIPLKELKGESKMSRLRHKPDPNRPILRKPEWIRIKAGNNANVAAVKKQLRDKKLHTVCEEASCPNLSECFSKRTATFMIMGGICTRRCPFCDVAHGRPGELDKDEPRHLAESIRDMGLRYVVVTSVDRDDLRDGGASHFVQCITESRALNDNLTVEVLVPDFRGRMDKALDIFEESLPDVFNHNLETIPRLYKTVRPGGDYRHSLHLLKQFKERYPDVTTKAGFMVGLGETKEEILDLMQDIRDASVDMITIGQYLQPSRHHLAVERYVTPEEFKHFEEAGYAMGFQNVASGPLVRSSYHADLQAEEIVVQTVNAGQQ